MKVYQIFNQVFFTDEQGVERACGVVCDEGFTFSSKAKAEREITEILKRKGLKRKEIQLFPKLHFESRCYPNYNGNRLVRRVYWLNEIEVL